LAKALKPCKKTYAAGAKAVGKKMFYTSAGRSGVTRAPKCALNLFGSDSSASDSEPIPVERPRKRSKETSIAQNIP
jgi:hypothetical protein